LTVTGVQTCALPISGEVVAHAGKLGVQVPYQLERVSRAVQEVWIAERDVPRPGGDQSTHVLQHHGARHREETPVVDRRDGAMEARMQATATRLDVSGRHGAAFAREPHVS